MSVPGAPLQLAVLISGRGSNMVAIAEACAAGRIRAEIAIVISDQPGAGGLQRAQELGLRTRVVDLAGFRGPQGTDRAGFEVALADAIDASGAELVVLAGFMRVLSPAFVARYEGRMLNIHPSLLPSYKGLHTHRRVLEAGESEHGATVHFVTAELDGGPIVNQGRVPVLPGDDPEKLSARVNEVERRIYPEAIGWIAAGTLRWTPAGPVREGADTA